MQHSNNGAVLASTGGAGRGRRVPGPSPALFLSYTNSQASTPSAEPKGPGGKEETKGGACTGMRRTTRLLACFACAASGALDMRNLFVVDCQGGGHFMAG